MAAHPSQQKPTELQNSIITKDVEGFCLTTAQMKELVVLNHEFADRLRHASCAYLEQAQELQSALLEITRDKYKLQFETGRSLMEASDIEGMSKIQQAWIKRVSDQYLAEAERILQVVSDTTALPWTPLQCDEKDDTSRAA